MNIPKLTIELVPKTSWFSNVRSRVSQEVWNQIRKDTYKKANYKCEVCGGVGSQWPVECHEVWEYITNQCRIQKLVRMIALCPSCHRVKHIGLAQKRGQLAVAKVHLQCVNGWDENTTEKYLDDSFAEWRERSKYQWKLDLSFLKNEFGTSAFNGV